MAPILDKLFPVNGINTVELLQTPTVPSERLDGCAFRNKLKNKNPITRKYALILKYIINKLAFNEIIEINEGC